MAGKALVVRGGRLIDGTGKAVLLILLFLVYAGRAAAEDIKVSYAAFTAAYMDHLVAIA